MTMVALHVGEALLSVLWFVLVFVYRSRVKERQMEMAPATNVALEYELRDWFTAERAGMLRL